MAIPLTREDQLHHDDESHGVLIPMHVSESGPHPERIPPPPFTHVLRTVPIWKGASELGFTTSPNSPPPPPPSPQPSSTSAATHHADYRPGEEVYERRLLVLRAAAGSPVAAAARSPAARLARGGAARRVRTAAVRAGVRRRRGGNPAHYRRQVRRPLHRRAQPPHPRPRRRLPRARHRDHSVSAWPVERVRMNCLQWRERERQSAIHSSSVRRR